MTTSHENRQLFQRSKKKIDSQCPKTTGRKTKSMQAIFTRLGRSFWVNLKLFCEEGGGEFFGLKRLQIVCLFAYADEFDGDAEFLLNGNQHAAAAGAVEFCDDQAGERGGFVKFPRLIEGVSSGGSVQN